MLPLFGKAEDKNDFGDYPEKVKQYLQCLFINGQHKYAFRSDSSEGFDTWQKQARPLLRKTWANILVNEDGSKQNRRSESRSGC
jgi:hypothetical protein